MRSLQNLGVIDMDICNVSTEEIGICSFVHDKFPDNISFDVVSVDAQHTLWQVPSVKTGKEYVKLLGKRHWDTYYQKLCVDTLYWNYLLKDLIQKKCTKGK